MLERLTDKELRELETAEHSSLQPYLFNQSVHPYFAAGEIHGLTAGIAARLGSTIVTIQVKNVVEKSTVFGWENLLAGSDDLEDRVEDLEVKIDKPVQVTTGGSLTGDRLAITKETTDSVTSVDGEAI